MDTTTETTMLKLTSAQTAALRVFLDGQPRFAYPKGHNGNTVYSLFARGLLRYLDKAGNATITDAGRALLTADRGAAECEAAVIADEDTERTA